MVEYISKKISKELDPVIKYLQAHYQLDKGEKVTEAEVLDYAVRHIAEEQFGYSKKKKVRLGLGLLKHAGMLKGGSRSYSEEIDHVVYGV